MQWGISEKSDGQMKLYSDIQDQHFQNRKIFFEKIGLDSKNVVSADLVHSDTITVVDTNHRGQIIPKTDGLLTKDQNIILTVTVSDCLPLYFVDSQEKIIGIAHAGWRGVLKNLPGRMVEEMINQFAADPKNIQVRIGPHIQKCHFEIKDDVARLFKEYEKHILKTDKKMTLDLAGVVKHLLLEKGILEKNIDISDECTYCLDQKYFSFRRDHPQKVEAMIAYITQ